MAVKRRLHSFWLFVSFPIEGKKVAGRRNPRYHLGKYVPNRNFQGYPLPKCDWDPDHSQWYHDPPSYTAQFDPIELKNAKRCCGCNMLPCCMTALKRKMIEAMKPHCHNPVYATEKGKILANNLLEEICGKTYMQRTKPVDQHGQSLLVCVAEAIPKFIKQAYKEREGDFFVEEWYSSDSDYDSDKDGTPYEYYRGDLDYPDPEDWKEGKEWPFDRERTRGDCGPWRNKLTCKRCADVPDRAEKPERSPYCDCQSCHMNSGTGGRNCGGRWEEIGWRKWNRMMQSGFAKSWKG